MIKLLEEYDGGGLRDSHYSRIIRAHLEAYGTGFDFCRFYEISYRKRAGIICLFNGSMTAELCEGAKPGSIMKHEISELVDFQKPYSVELPHELAGRGFSRYIGTERRFFEIPSADSADGLISPEPDEVFSALGLPKDSYPIWLTDTLRRVNHGYSELLGYRSSVLTVRFKSEGLAFITDLATPVADRGKGYARELLGISAKKLANGGYTAYLAAMPELWEFYRSLGCREVGADKVYISKENTG